jgi:hypothetical protein
MSAAHPVALMTFGSGNLQGVPWEVVVKAYRDQLGAKSHDHLKAYAADFFEYVQANLYLYPQDLQEGQFLAAVVDAASFILARAWGHETVKTETDASRKNELFIQVYYRQLHVIRAAAFIGDITADFPVSILARYQDRITDIFRNHDFIKLFENDLDLRDLVTVAVFSLFKKSLTTFDQSGIVVAGFGDKEYFPQLSHYTCYSIVLGKLICECDRDYSISQGNTSEIIPFAQSDMTKTFMYGINVDALADIDTDHARSLDAFEAALKNDGKLQQSDDLSAIKAQTQTDFQQRLIDRSLGSHTTPLRRVVGLLPFDELAELAEILITIESLKERMTRNTEQVARPIDVAVISKGDGFIWVKRKHYFDPKLNPRFFTRRGMRHDEKS